MIDLLRLGGGRIKRRLHDDLSAWRASASNSRRVSVIGPDRLVWIGFVSPGPRSRNETYGGRPRAAPRRIHVSTVKRVEIRRGSEYYVSRSRNVVTFGSAFERTPRLRRPAPFVSDVEFRLRRRSSESRVAFRNSRKVDMSSFVRKKLESPNTRKRVYVVIILAFGLQYDRRTYVTETYAFTYSNPLVSVFDSTAFTLLMSRYCPPLLTPTVSSIAVHVSLLRFGTSKHIPFITFSLCLHRPKAFQPFEHFNRFEI